MTGFGWAAVAWLCGWAVDCGQFTFHSCDGCRDEPEPSCSQWLLVYLWSMVCWPLDLAALTYFNIKNRGKRS